jgi:hypothetical protein
MVRDALEMRFNANRRKIERQPRKQPYLTLYYTPPVADLLTVPPPPSIMSKQFQFKLVLLGTSLARRRLTTPNPKSLR